MENPNERTNGSKAENLDITDPFYFEAPWQEKMVAKKGDMICTTDGSEIYRIARKEFEQTYRIASDGQVEQSQL